MAKITEFNRTNLRVLADQVEDALVPVAMKHGLTVELRGGSYTRDGEWKPKVVFTVEGGDAKRFASLAHYYGLKPEDFGKTFKSRGQVYRIKGINTRAKRMPILVESVESGRTYKMTELAVQLGLGRKVIR